MIRYNFIDNIKGLSFFFMLIHHIFYFYDIVNNTSYTKNPYIIRCGSIARNIFIFMVGFTLVYTYNNNKLTQKKFIYKRINASFKILFHALLITLITYYYFPSKYIRFGVLHFIGLSTLILILILPFKQLYYILLIILIFLLICTKRINNPYNLLKYKKISINPFLDIIIGQTNPSYPMIDWFPLLSWVPIVLLGMITANNINNNYINNNLNFNNIITWTGRNSLYLYTFHVYLLIILYNLNRRINN